MKIAFKENGAFDSNKIDGDAILDESIFNVKPANDEILYIELDSFGNIEKAETCALGMSASNDSFEAALTSAKGE